MKKEKVDYKLKIKEHSLVDKELKYLNFKLYYKRIILAVVFAIMLIVSLCLMRRINIFAQVFSFGADWMEYVFGYGLYYLFLALAFIYNFVLVVYISIKKARKDYWLIDVFDIDENLDLPSFIVSTMSSVLFILIFMFTPCTVVGNSMDSTLANGDKLISTNMFYTPKDGDIVIIDASNYTHENAFYIKRVVAKAGDKVAIDEGKLYVNDELIQTLKVCTENGKAEYVNIIESIGLDSSVTEFTVPKNKTLVMGDNRDNSKDSRTFGFVDYKDVYGVVLFRLTPLKKFGSITQNNAS